MILKQISDLKYLRKEMEQMPIGHISTEILRKNREGEEYRVTYKKISNDTVQVLDEYWYS